MKIFAQRVLQPGGAAIIFPKNGRNQKITTRTGQTFWDRQLCFYVKKSFVSEKTQKNELCHFSKEIYVTNFALRA